MTVKHFFFSDSLPITAQTHHIVGGGNCSNVKCYCLSCLYIIQYSSFYLCGQFGFGVIVVHLTILVSVALLMFLVKPCTVRVVLASLLVTRVIASGNQYIDIGNHWEVASGTSIMVLVTIQMSHHSTSHTVGSHWQSHHGISIIVLVIIEKLLHGISIIAGNQWDKFLLIWLLCKLLIHMPKKR